MDQEVRVVVRVGDYQAFDFAQVRRANELLAGVYRFHNLAGLTGLRRIRLTWSDIFNPERLSEESVISTDGRWRGPGDRRNVRFLICSPTVSQAQLNMAGGGHDLLLQVSIDDRDQTVRWLDPQSPNTFAHVSVPGRHLESLLSEVALDIGTATSRELAPWLEILGTESAGLQAFYSKKVDLARQLARAAPTRFIDKAVRYATISNCPTRGPYEKVALKEELHRLDAWLKFLASAVDVQGDVQLSNDRLSKARRRALSRSPVPHQLRKALETMEVSPKFILLPRKAPSAEGVAQISGDLSRVRASQSKSNFFAHWSRWWATASYEQLVNCDNCLEAMFTDNIRAVVSL